MWDQISGKSRGFGFVVFKEKADAEKALAGMNGQWLGSRAIRCNWANQKGEHHFQHMIRVMQRLTLCLFS